VINIIPIIIKLKLKFAKLVIFLNSFSLGIFGFKNSMNAPRMIKTKPSNIKFQYKNEKIEITNDAPNIEIPNETNT
jgi:hypothetical protein